MFNVFRYFITTLISFDVILIEVSTSKYILLLCDNKIKKITMFKLTVT